MRELTIVSGKGGTGKTSVVASFAALAKNAVLVDCDVDAPNLALVLEPHVERSAEFVGGKTARIDPTRCTACGQCVDVCNFQAISPDGPSNSVTDRTHVVDAIACEGCGVCAALCPEKAIDMLPAVNGEWFVSRMRHGPMVHAKLGIAEDNSGKLVTLLRKEARALAKRLSRELVICDGPPGIGCPAIASLTGADIALVVAEATVSGIHDFERVVNLADHFNIPCLACVNRFDINEEMTDRIERLATELGVERVGRIPYDDAVVRAQLSQASVVEYDEGGAGTAIRDVWEQVKMRLTSSALKQR